MKSFSRLPKTDKQIKQAITWGIVAALVSAALQMLSLGSDIYWDRVQAENTTSIFFLVTMVEILIKASLAYGIYKRHRLAADILFVYFILSGINSWIVFDSPPTPWILLYLLGAAQAMRGLEAYHQRLEQSKDVSEDTAAIT